jgi:putative ATP-dependent endonuclease of the OLD family
MRLTRIRIENYRSIKSLDFQPGMLCALVGENNAGKSNILRALNLILGESWPSERMFSEEDFYNHDTSKEITIEIWGDTPHILNRYGVTLECRGLRIVVGHYKRAVKSKGKVAGDLKFGFWPIDKNGDPVNAPDQPLVGGKKVPWSPLRVNNDIRDAFPFVYVDVHRDYARHTPGSRWSVLNRLFSGVNDDFQRIDNTVLDSDGKSISRRDAFRQRVDTAFTLLRTPEFEKVENTIRNHALRQVGLDPASSDVHIEFRPFDPLNAYKSLTMVISEGGQEFEADEIGAGYQSSIVVAIFRAYQELNRQGAIIAIEEPEVFLHPHRQRYFHKVLNEIANGGSQVFYTTHSAQFVDVVAPENICIVRRIYADGTKVFTCPCQQWTPDQKERLKLEKEFDPERNEMFFAKGVLLCEGDTEKALYPVVMQSKGIDLDEIGLSVVEVGGKKNLPIFIKVLEAFRIAYVVIFDEDDTKDKTNQEITSLVSDSTRLFIHHPNLEQELGYVPRSRSKIESALIFIKKGLSESQENILFGPIQRLLKDIRPEIIRNTQTPTIITDVNKG